MKIALIHFGLTTESGDTRMVLSIAQGLKKLGHTVAVYCGEFDARACYPRLNKGLDIRVVPPRQPLASVRGATGIFGRISERVRQVRLQNDLAKRILSAVRADFDVLICENDYSYKIGLGYKQQRPDAKVIWIMNNPPFFHSRKSGLVAEVLSRCANAFEKLSARKYARGVDWIVVYDEISKRLAKALGRPVKVVPNPIDVGYFYAPVREGIAGKKIGLLGLGALSPQRRFEDIVTAVALLRRKGYDARAVMLCKDYWGNSAYRKGFEEFVRSSGVGEYIEPHFEGANDEEYLKAIRSSDVFVLPNNIKIWGVGAFECMAAGLPLIVSRVTAVAEALHDRGDALFVDVSSPAQIADRAEELARDPALYKKVASAGQAFVKEEMSLDSFVEKIIGLAVGKSAL